jgi:ssDNA-binding Zn-finger/Zn-ribbon topoisomerase 1
MKFSIPELQNFLYKELGYEKRSVSARNFVSWNRFYSSDDFIYIKPIKPRNLIITLWDSGEGVTYNSLMKGYIDKGEPVFMARKINLDENMYSQLTEHSNFFEQYALQPENECPSCGGILVPRKMKKLKQEDPYALAKAVSGPNAIPKQRTYLACNNYPVCTHVASYVRI